MNLLDGTELDAGSGIFTDCLVRMTNASPNDLAQLYIIVDCVLIWFTSFSLSNRISLLMRVSQHECDSAGNINHLFFLDHEEVLSSRNLEDVREFTEEYWNADVISPFS